MIEIEKKYIVTQLPKDLELAKSKIVEDTIVKVSKGHPQIRVRRDGNNFEINKKYPRKGSASLSEMVEEIIKINRDEYNTLKKVDGYLISKKRYYYTLNNNVIEINVYKGNLKGLVLAEVEFESAKDRDSFKKPKFLGMEVTENKFFATGNLITKTFQDVQEEILRIGARI